MNSILLYNPFEKIDLLGTKCFLTGDELSSNEESMFVFPKWLMESENLYDKAFKILDESYKTYGDLKIPVSKKVSEKIEALNDKIKNYFRDNSIKSVPTDLEWFHWSGIIVYGLIYNEIRFGLKSEEFKEEGFRISPTLINKFKTLHLQLQSLIYDFEWDDPMPFSLLNYDLNESVDFEHRNEINTLTFSFKLNNRGMIICLQDAGNTKFYHKELLKHIPKMVHPIQFAELEAKVYYTNYLLSILPEFDLRIINEKIYITNVEVGLGSRPTFDKWDEKTFSQVLEAFWKKWNISRIEIFKNAEKCMSYLLDSDNKFIQEIKV